MSKAMSIGGARGIARGRLGPGEKLRNPKQTIKRLLSYLTHRRLVLVGVFFLCLVTTVIHVFATRLYGHVLDEYIMPLQLSGIMNIGLVILGMHLLAFLALYGQQFIMLHLAQQTTATIREQLFSKMQRLPLHFYDKNSSGDLMSRLTNDVDNINVTLSQNITQLFSGVITIVGMLVAMILLSPLLTLIGLLTTPLMFLNSRYLVRKTQPFFVNQQKKLGELNGYIEENISAQKVITLFSQQEASLEAFKTINRQLTKASIKAQIFSSIMFPINNFINNITFLILAVSGGILILYGADLTVGVVFTFILFMRNFTRPINEILNLFSTIQTALAGAERVFEVMDEPIEQDEENAQPIESLKGDVTFKAVSFSYEPDKPILKGASIEAKCGEMIAIVGPTGAGKTTIINLLTKFYDVKQGEILIDGQNINGITRQSLRQNISMVLQDTYLFSETIRENIRYGCLDATDEEIVKAAKLANAHRFIMQLPRGYDTQITNNGSHLSQGQRQLLAIARAIISKATILILDEATSSIDTRTEIEIQQALLNLMKGKTTFVIAHRLSTIKKANQILVLKNGNIIEQGHHEELLATKGFYADLYKSQFK